MRVQGMMTIILTIGLAGGPIRESAAAVGRPLPREQMPPAAQMPVDINHASLEDLLKVPGMTRSWAGRIVRFRPYRTKQDLLDRGVVSGEVYRRIKDNIIAHREKQ